MLKRHNTFAALTLALMTGCSELKILDPGTSTKPSSQPSATSSPRPSSTVPGPSATPAATASNQPNATPSPSLQPSPQPTSQASTTPAEPGLMLYLDMDKSPNEYLYNGLPVTSKGVTANVQGKVGQSWNFDGQGSFMKIPLDINPSKHPQLTLSAWVRYKGLDMQNIFQVISHDDGGFDRAIGIDPRGKYGWGWAAFVGPIQQILGVPQPVVKDEWTFLTGVFDQQAKTVTFYVNGNRYQVDNTETGEGFPYINIGANPGYGQHFTGDIDEVRIFDKALTASEVQNLYQAASPVVPPPVPPADKELLLYLNMEKKPGDYLHNGFPVTSKGVTPNLQGKVGQAWNFDGQGSFMKIPLNINPSRYPQLTMSAWVRYTGLDKANTFQVISHDDGGFDRAIGIDPRGKYGWGWAAFVGPIQQILGVPQPVVKDEWTFLTGVFDQQAKTATFYVNGNRYQVDNTETGEGFPYINIGANPGYGQHFTGDIDEVRIFGRALSETEVQGLYGGAPTATSTETKIFDNGNILQVFNGAPCVPTFTTERDYLLSEIMDYHWNDAQGQVPPGSIGLKSSTGIVYGPWEITTGPGQGGVPNAYWYARPANVLLPKGSYTITDSQPQSWSYNPDSKCAISWVKGIPR